MKAICEIRFKNLRGFDANGNQKPGADSSLRVRVGEDVEQKLKENGYDESETKDAVVRIMRGNKHWVQMDTPKEEELQKKVDKAKEAYEKRYEELRALNSKEQLALLKALGVTSAKAPVSEDDKCKLIIELESKR